jgi:hypothetical protein
MYTFVTCNVHFVQIVDDRYMPISFDGFRSLR